MQLNRKDFQLLNRLLGFWVSKGLVTEEQSVLLRRSIQEKQTGWAASSSFMLFIAWCFCGVLAAAAVLMDEKLITFILQLFDTSAFVKSAGFAAIAFAAFAMGLRTRKRMPDRIYSRESFYFLGVFTGCSIRLVSW